ncbi:hypothetical protein PSTT_03350 [Puccinia striiformis]|uniref:Uncharacterized protein n=1 Tax=Puccinia striiformis TaxID=27350 RepID=A0A2S4VWV2_9BASI|nr:hypothetical protein PSTT_03350 [Puccinia striiformis]
MIHKTARRYIRPQPSLGAHVRRSPSHDGCGQGGDEWSALTTAAITGAVSAGARRCSRHGVGYYYAASRPIASSGPPETPSNRFQIRPKSGPPRHPLVGPRHFIHDGESFCWLGHWGRASSPSRRSTHPTMYKVKLHTIWLQLRPRRNPTVTRALGHIAVKMTQRPRDATRPAVWRASELANQRQG